MTRSEYYRTTVYRRDARWLPTVEVLTPIGGGLYLARIVSACPMAPLYGYIIGSFHAVIEGAGMNCPRLLAAHILDEHRS